MAEESTEPGGGVDPAPFVSQPLPPEVPAPRLEPSAPAPDPAEPDDLSAAAPDPEWWRAPPSGVSEWAAADTGTAPSSTGPGMPDPGRWPGAEVEVGHGMEGVVAAHEIGAQIGDAISSHLPAPQGQARKLDLRWLLLRYNVPGVLLALLVTWRGQSSVDRMAAVVSRDGVFAPLGIVLVVVLLGLVLMVLPVGSALGAALGHLVSAAVTGVVQLVRRAWAVRYIGYLLRLAVAVVVWSVVIAVGRVIWRAAVHFLTGA